MTFQNRSILRDREECCIAGSQAIGMRLPSGTKVCMCASTEAFLASEALILGRLNSFPKIFSIGLLLMWGRLVSCLKNLQRMNTERTSTINRPGGGGKQFFVTKSQSDVSFLINY